MLRHIVMWTLKQENKHANAQIIKEKLEALQGEIDGLLKVEVGIDLGSIEGNYDVVLISDFDDENALNAYQVHPLHKEAGAFIKSVATGRACVDYII